MPEAPLPSPPTDRADKDKVLPPTDPAGATPHPPEDKANLEAIAAAKKAAMPPPAVPITQKEHVSPPAPGKPSAAEAKTKAKEEKQSVPTKRPQPVQEESVASKKASVLGSAGPEQGARTIFHFNRIMGLSN